MNARTLNTIESWREDAYLSRLNHPCSLEASKIVRLSDSLLICTDTLIRLSHSEHLIGEEKQIVEECLREILRLIVEG